VAENQVLVARGWRAVLGGVDLPVRAVDADAQDAHEYAPAAGDVVDGGLRRLAQVDRIGLPGDDGDGFHGRSDAVGPARVSAGGSGTPLTPALSRRERE
jgi:hypothetical protein